MVPGPRDAAQKWLAFGSIVLVAVSASFASRACKSHLESTLPRPAPAEAFPAPSAPEPVTYDESDPSDGDGDGDDAGAPPPANIARDAPAGTPDGSAKAKPSWAATSTRRSQAAYDAVPYAPVHSKPNEVFASASSIDGELARAFVICRGRDPGDARMRQQLQLRSVLGRTPMFAADGPPKSGQVFASAPLVTLRKPDAVEVTLFSYRGDVLEQRVHESSTFDGALSPTTEARGELECRALTGDELADRVAIDAGRADAAIARLASAEVNVSRRGWGHPNVWVAQARRTTSDVAALVGWDDPRAKKRVSDLAIALALFDTKWDQRFDEELRKAGMQTKLGALRITLGAARCKADDDESFDACTVAVTVKNEGTEPFAWTDVTGSIARKNGNAFVLRFDDDEPDDIAPSQTASLTFRTSREILKSPSLAVFCTDGACGSVRLR